MTAEQNLRLLREIDANREFILMAYRQNPQLLERAEPRIRQLFDQPVDLKLADRRGHELKGNEA